MMNIHLNAKLISDTSARAVFTRKHIAAENLADSADATTTGTLNTIEQRPPKNHVRLG